MGATNVPIPGRNNNMPSAIMLETTLLAVARLTPKRRAISRSDGNFSSGR
jgi:hypothetical protein